MTVPHVISTDHHPTLRHVDRQAIGDELQHILVVLVDLSLLGKQAHWNVTGPHFRSLHLHLDEMVDAWREDADRVAERAVALGVAPDGRAGTVAARSPLTPLPEDQIADRDVVAALTRLLTDAVGAVRDRAAPLEDLDPVTADVLHGVIATLEEQLWMIRVQAG
jgi:starvation-inducible DNA-binding protein